MKQASLDVNGLNMVYSTAGDASAPPLIMIHGWGSSKGVWRTTIPALEARFYCIAVDLIGYGDSDIPHHPDVTIPAQAKRVTALIDALGYDRVHLIGHSMGGQIALYLASQVIPDRVDKLVNIAGVATGQLTPAAERDLPVLKLSQYFPILLASSRLWCHTRLYARRYCSHWFYDMDCVPLDFWRDDRNRINQPGAHRSLYRSWEAMTACDLTDMLGQITVPALTIFGKQDNVVPIDAGRVADAQIPDHQLVWIDACGHFPMYEQRDIYRKTLKDFLFEADAD